MIHSFKNTLNGSRVLVVEDNDINLELSIHLLEEVGIITDFARNGLEAIEKIKRNTYDAVLMDIQMPEMDGLTATRELRKIKELATLPILAMTAHAMKGEREKSIEAGMNDHINKPIDPILLYNALLKSIKDEELSNARIQNNIATETPFALEGLDVADGLYRSGNKLINYQKLLASFAERNKNITKKGQQYINENKLNDLAALLHLLAGVTGNLGANQIYNKAILLSQSLHHSEKHNDVEAAQERYSEVMQLLQEVEDLSKRIIKYIDSLGSTTIEESIAMNDAEFSESLLELKSLIQNNDAIAQEKCLQLSQSLPNNDPRKTSLMNISNTLDEFEFDAALEILKSMAS
jgi:two-component system sensor histidine kinase/response regulator